MTSLKGSGNQLETGKTPSGHCHTWRSRAQMILGDDNMKELSLWEAGGGVGGYKIRD